MVLNRQYCFLELNLIWYFKEKMYIAGTLTTFSDQDSKTGETRYPARPAG